MAEEPAQEKLQFRLETDGIEAKALVRILQDTHLTFREIGKANATPDAELKIYPFRQGSFEYAIAVVAGLNTVVATLGVFREILAYKKAKLEYRKSQTSIFEEKPKQVRKPEPPTVLQNNPSINIYLNGMLKAIGDHSAGFSVSESSSSGVGFHFSEHEIRTILEIERGSRETSFRQTIELPNEKLSLKAISTKPYGKWKFIYDGNNINAGVPEGLKKGAQFNQYQPGTIFYVTLSVRQEYNDTAKAWLNMNYRVTQIHKIENP